MIPREHGAWAMMLVPFAAGVAVAREFNVAVPLFLVACIALFMARYPLGLLWKNIGKRQDSGRFKQTAWAALYLGIALGSLGLLFLLTGRLFLITLAAPVVLLLSVHLYLQRIRLGRSVGGQLVGIAALSWVAPMSYYVASGRFDSIAIVLWALTFLYSGASVFYVKMKVRQRTANADNRWQQARGLVLYLGLVSICLAGLVAVQAAPPLAAIAFVPLFYKSGSAAVFPRAAKSIKQIGFAELGHAILFVLLIVGSFLIVPAVQF